MKKFFMLLALIALLMPVSGFSATVECDDDGDDKHDNDCLEPHRTAESMTVSGGTSSLTLSVGNGAQYTNTGGNVSISGTFTGSLTGNADTATALAANPAACSANFAVTDIDADGTLTCGAIYGPNRPDVAVLDGGTGSSTVSGAASNLGLGVEDSVVFTSISTTETGFTATTAGAQAANITVLSTATLPADSIDAITEIASGLKSGSDTTLITGTAGTSGHCGQWNADGDLVTSGAACGGATAWDDIGNPDAADTIDFGTYQIDIDAGSGGLRIGDGGSNYANFASTGVITFAGTGGITGNLTFSDADQSPSAVGEIMYDNTVTGFHDGNLAWHDGVIVRYLIDTGTLADTDGQLIAYNATMDGYSPVSMSGDATMAASGAVTIAANAVDDTMINKFVEVKFLPVGWFIDGGTPPAVEATLSSTNKIQYRDFAGATADEDVQIPWMAPPDLVVASGVKYRVITYISAATGPSAEGVSFFMQGTSLGDGDILSSSMGTAMESNITSQTHVRYDRMATNWSSAMTSTHISNLAVGETVHFKLYRDFDDADDTYAQELGVVGIELKYERDLSTTF